MKRLIAVFIALPMLAAPAKVTLCHVLSDPPRTMDVPEQAVDNHLAHGDYLGACVAPEPTPEPAPASNSPVVISNMWLIRGVVTGEPFDPDYMRWKRMNYCILISDTHPSYEQQLAKCFPPFGWYPLGAPCAGSVTADDTWACDDELAERGWTRLPLAELCKRHPEWCGR